MLNRGVNLLCLHSQKKDFFRFERCEYLNKNRFMNNTVKFKQAIDEVAKVTPMLVGESQETFKSRSAEFLKDVEESQFIKVPLVGVFSAGKSSLLNVFTQKVGMLPVDTAPETAVAYELYYDTNERVELYREGSKIDTQSLANIKDLDTKPGDIAKVYSNSESIKRLQDKGIILVDMPGIGSGIERHDAAIFNYIDKATAFIVVVDVEQGSLRNSTMTFMQELDRYGIHPVVMVSKIDKKATSDVKEVVEYVKYQMTKLGDQSPYVSTVCAANNDVKGLYDYLDTLNAENIVAEGLRRKFEALTNSVVEQLKVRVAVRNADVANVDQKLKLLEEQIENVKTELPTGNSNADTPEKSTQDILDNVKSVLEAKAQDIAQMVVDREDQETIKAAIVSIVRAEIIVSLKEESEQYTTALGSSVQDTVKNIAAIEIDDNVLGEFSDIVDGVKIALQTILGTLGGIWGKIASFLLQYLPNIINWLFGKSKEELVQEVTDKIKNQCVNKIIEALQPAIFNITVSNQKRIQERIQQEVVAKMEQVKEGLREKMADANKSKADVEAEIANLNAAISQVENVVASI